MSAEHFPVALDSNAISGRTDAACKKGTSMHTSTLCATTYPSFVECALWHMLLHSGPPAAAHVDVLSFSALTRNQIVSALWQVVLQKQLQVREGRIKCWHHGYTM